MTQAQFPTFPSSCFLFGQFLLSCCTPLPCRQKSLSSSVSSIWLVTNSHFFLNVLCCCFCYLMIIYLIFSPCPHSSHWLSVSPHITRSPLPPCLTSQQAPWLPPLLLHLTFDYSSTGATNAVTWQHQRASHCSSTFSDLAIFSVLPKCSFLNHLPAHRWVKPPEKLNVKQKPSLNMGRILTFPLSPKERLNYKRFKTWKVHIKGTSLTQNLLAIMPSPPF